MYIILSEFFTPVLSGDVSPESVCEENSSSLLEQHAKHLQSE